MKLSTALILGFTLLAGSSAWASAGLPPAAAKLSRQALEEVGSGTYRKLGFSIYRATLFAPDGELDQSKPFALRLHYTRSLSKSTVVDALLDSIEEQNVASKEELASWRDNFSQFLGDVEDGDEVVAVNLPGKSTQFFKNGQPLTAIGDRKLCKAFFDIWLGETADESLREALTTPAATIASAK